MFTTMSAGRLVIPREIRREAAIERGTPLEVRLRAGVIEIGRSRSASSWRSGVAFSSLSRGRSFPR